MASAATEDPVVPDTTSTRLDPIDAEADADAALKTLRNFVISDAPVDAPPLESWPALDSYIEELCSYGVDRLTREPHDLTASSLRLKNDLEDVACSNYRALIESFECADAVRDGVARVKHRLDDLVETLPQLAEATRQFSIHVTERQAERQARLRSLSHMSAVADILEIPRLMRTLVASELYDEALELRDHALKMAVMYPSAGGGGEGKEGDLYDANDGEGRGDVLIGSVCEEIHVLTQQMVLQLLVLLRNAVQLPTCLRVIGFLRRLRLFSELRLRMLFLYCRGEWMRTGIEAASATTTQAHLVNLSDNTRAMVFEIVTQYRAVFSDEDEETERNEIYDDQQEPSFLGRNGGSSSLNSSTFTIHSSAILFDWTASCVADYLHRLRDGVDELTDAAALNTVLQQAMFCGQSLGRVGADFRAALPSMFERAVIRIFHSHLHAALRQFEMMVDDNRWAPVGSSALRKDRNSTMFPSSPSSPLTTNTNSTTEKENDENNNDDGNLDKQKQNQDSYDPPQGVLDSPPLAVFLNGLLVALNDLRLCSPASLASRLGDSMQDTLIKAGEYISAIGGPGGAFLKRSDRPHFIAMSVSLRDLCVRHAARCLDHCMSRHGLVNISVVDQALLDVFGDTLAPTMLSSHASEVLNGVENEDGADNEDGANNEDGPDFQIDDDGDRKYGDESGNGVTPFGQGSGGKDSNIIL